MQHFPARTRAGDGADQASSSPAHPQTDDSAFALTEKLAGLSGQVTGEREKVRNAEIGTPKSVLFREDDDGWWWMEEVSRERKVLLEISLMEWFKGIPSSR